MSFINSINLLEKRGNLKGFSKEQKEDFINSCESHFVFYDPYKNVFINLIESKTYYPKTLERFYLNSKRVLEIKLSNDQLSDKKFKKALKKINSQNRISNNLESFIKTFTFLGIIIGGILAYFIDYSLGLSVGFFLIFFDYNTFDKVNGVINEMESSWMTSLLWKKNKNIYFFSSFILLILSLVFLYIYSKSIMLTIGFFFFQKWFLVNPVVQFIASTGFRKMHLASRLEDKYIIQNKNLSFLKDNPKGIKIIEVNYSKEEDYGPYEQYNICYRTVKGDYSVTLAIYSNLREGLIKEDFTDISEFLFDNDELKVKPLMNEKQLELLISKEKLLKKIYWLENNPRAEFYFEKISNNLEFSYFVLLNKNEVLINNSNFEGSFSENIYKQYHENGKLYESIEYKNGIKHGSSKSFHKNGELEFECSLENGFLIPSNVVFKHQNGVNRITGSLRKKDKKYPELNELYNPDSIFKIGIWEIFDENENLLKSVEYKSNGEKKTLFTKEGYTGINNIL